MCGIAGCYHQADQRKLPDVMTDRIAHRGHELGGSVTDVIGELVHVRAAGVAV